MKKLIVLSSEEHEQLIDIIDRLDIEIGSTINSADNQFTVLNNMRRANNILHSLKELIDYEEE